MIRVWRDLWGILVALGVTVTVVIRWRRGEIAVVPHAAAPTIRLVAVLLVFLQGCADRLRGREEPGPGAGQTPPGSNSGSNDAGTNDAGQPPGGGSDQPPPGGGSESAGQTPPGGGAAGAGASGAGAQQPPPPAVDDALPIRSESEAITFFQLQRDRGDSVSGFKRLARLLAPLADGTGPDAPVWDQALMAADDLRHVTRSTERGEAFRDAFRAHIEARRRGAEDPEGLLRLLDAAEALPVFDAWLAAYVWRRAAPLPLAAPRREALLARVERHVRVHLALLKGQTVTGPVEFHAWRSKAGPPMGWSGISLPDGFVAAAQRAYATGDAGTWDSAGTIALRVEQAQGLSLVRRGKATPLAAGQSLVLRRLDLLRAEGPALLRHAELGDMSLGAGAIVTAWDLGDRLAPAGRELARAWAAKALAGDAQALARIEAALPALHAEVRRVLAEKPDAKGAAGLRMALALFDE